MADELALNAQWRKRIREIGLRNFEREEMLRLGFLSELNESERKRIGGFLEISYPKLIELKQALELITKEIGELGEVESILKEVRRARIERVKRERMQKKALKEKESAARKAAWSNHKTKTPPFLGVDVSSRLKFSGGDSRALKTRSLPAASNAQDLAKLMDISTSDLIWLCYERAASSVDHYVRFEIPKRTGGTRLISSPKPRLRTAQSWVKEHILDKLHLGKAATAFRPGSSIVANARPHLRAAIVIRIDFKDFFPSITFPRVRGYFEHLGYNPGTATLLALICTDAPRAKVTLDDKDQFVAIGKRSLPQGACTSPALANLIASKFDSRVDGLCRKLSAQWSYTRYADDVSLSTQDDTVNIGQILGAITYIAKSEGFTINPQKTAIMRAPNRQIVTGLMVGNEIRLSRRDLRRYRAFLHRCDMDGRDKVTEEIGKDALSVARGQISYINMVMPGHARKLRDKYEWL